MSRTQVFEILVSEKECLTDFSLLSSIIFRSELMFSSLLLDLGQPAFGAPATKQYLWKLCMIL